MGSELRRCDPGYEAGMMVDGDDGEWVLHEDAAKRIAELDQEAKTAVEKHVLAYEETLRLERELAEAKEETANVTKNAVTLLGQACNVHSLEIKDESFAEFKEREDARGCSRCLGAERDALKAALDGQEPEDAFMGRAELVVELIEAKGKVAKLEALCEVEESDVDALKAQVEALRGLLERIHKEIGGDGVRYITEDGRHNELAVIMADINAAQGIAGLFKAAAGEGKPEEKPVPPHVYGKVNVVWLSKAELLERQEAMDREGEPE